MTTPAAANPAFEIVTAPALPSALVRAPVADGAGGVYAIVKDRGVAHVRDGKVTMLAGLTSPRVHDLTRGGDGALYAATDAGLMRLVGARFQPAGAPMPVVRVETDAAGTVWAVAKTPKGITVLKAGQTAGEAPCRKLVTLTTAGEAALVVCQDAVHRVDDRLTTPELMGTPPYSTPPTGDRELRRPAVWLTGAASDLVFSQTSAIVRVTATGVKAVATNTPVKAACTAPNGDVLTTDFEGRITRITSTSTSPLFTEPGAEHLHAGPSGAIWIATSEHLVRRQGDQRTVYSLKGSDYLSPGVLELIELSGRAVLATNDGLWLTRPWPQK